jgi:uncharacterized repeat protein (TIGR01451 family)
MFKKIVSNLPFSPSLVGQLGFYAKRLRQEETTRRLGLIFVALAIAVQSLVVFQPPESANASNASDMVLGGVGENFSTFLTSYDNNVRHLKDIMTYKGITREEIVATKYTSWGIKDNTSWGLAPKYSYDQGERVHNITNASGQLLTTVYSRPLSINTSYNSSSKIFGWAGYSKTAGWFGIMKDCGNLVTHTVAPAPIPEKCAVNPNILASDPNCKTCPGNFSLWINDPACVPNIIKAKTATNITQGFVQASSVVANSDDQISYTITVENIGLKPSTVKLEDYLADTLEYSTVTDSGGGILNKTTMVLTWPDITLSPKTKQTRTFIVKILNVIPLTSQGTSEKTSFDCIMTNTFGNSIDVRINCPTPKIIENVVTQLPVTGPAENILFIGIILSTTAYFYARTRQLKKEIKIIRRDASSGII